jgi:2-polyprenyl-6-methoxyphenol 4-hydroxylase
MTNQSLIRQDVDISIIGGGMVGASLALLLSSCKCGWRIQIVDAQPMQTTQSIDGLESYFDARSTALSQSSREIFEILGLWENLSPKLTEISEVHVSDKGYPGSARLCAEEQNLPALGYVVENRWISSALSEALIEAEDIEIVDSAKIAELKAVKGGMKFSVSTAGVGKSREVNSKLLVIADGAKSETRNMLGIDFTVKDYGQVAIVANVSLSQDHAGIAYERFSDSGPIAMLPLEPIDGDYRASLVWTVSLIQAEKLLSESEDAFLKELQLCFGYRLGKLQRIGTRYSFPVRLVTSNEQVRSNVVVVGNAAHSLHPVAGQGFNLALRDVAMLANELAKAEVEGSSSLGEYSVLERYLDNQKLDQERTILLSDLLPRTFGNRALPIVLARNIGLLALDVLPLFRRNFTQLGMGLQTRGHELAKFRPLDSLVFDTGIRSDG